MERDVTGLIKRCFEGDAEGVKALLDGKADASFVAGFGITPLHAAVAGGHTKCVEV